MIDWSNIQKFVIPEGEVSAVACNGEILWQKQTQKYKAELEYLETTGTQWIDTGVMAPLTAEITLQGVEARKTTSIVSNIGSAVGGGDYFGFRSYWMVGTGATEIFDIEYSEKITADIVWTDKGITVTIDGATVTRSGGVSGELRVGSPESSYYACCKIFGLRTYTENGVLTRDFIPVLDWDDIPCMYDKVTHELFYNQGTGEFLWG